MDTGRRIRGLDGIRAIAVVAVLIFHLRPASLPGGFIGVDIFFVVSGFLITTLLLREIRRENKVDLPGFWLRRARRLLPALWVVVPVSVAAALLLGDDLLVGIGRQTLGAATFSTNWIEIAAGSSYFAGTSPQLFVHFWSLAVEEQFYLLWPILFVLMLVLVPSPKARIYTALGGAVASAVLMAALFTPGADATRVYYGLDTHAFGLLLGVALAFAWAGTRIFESRFFRKISSLTALGSLVGLAALMWTLDEHTAFTFRGGLFLACVLTALLIASLLPETPAVLALTELRPLVWLGERSYGIYLWHWPAILLLTALFPPVAIDSAAHWAIRGVALVATLAIAAWSFTYIETPVRRYGFKECGRRVMAAVRGPVLVPKLAAGGFVLLLVLSTLGIVTAPEKSAVQAAIEAVENEQVPEIADGAGEDPAGPENPQAGVINVDAEVEGTDAEEVDAEPDPYEDEAAVPPAGAGITVFGDSMVVTSKDGLEYVLPGIHLEAKSNRQWKDAGAIVDAALAAGTVRDSVALAFGTNAGVTDPEVVRGIIDSLGPDRAIALVNLYSNSTFIASSNALLAEIAAEYPNVAIADWNAAASADPGALQSDRTHPNIPGATLFAQTLEAAFATLDATVPEN